MADTKISDLAEDTAPTATDLLVTVDVSASASKKVQIGNLPGIAAAKIASGTIATARLGSGTASASTFLRGDQTWAIPAGGGGGATIAATSSLLKGDGAGNGVAATAGTDYLAPTGNGSALTGLAKSQVGLANVDNTSDAAKPISTAQQAALLSRLDAYNVLSYGADPTGVADSTEALLAAIDACVAGGGGTVYLPAGKYLCDGPYDPALGGVVTFPAIRFDTQPQITIRLLGAGAPMLVWGAFDMPAPSGGTVIRTTRAGGIALFSSRNPAGGFAGYTAINLFLESFAVETYGDPDITVFDLRYFANVVARDICVYPGLTSYAAVPEPTHADQYAFRFPNTNNAAVVEGQNLLAYGHYNAFEIGECFQGTGQVWAFHCKVGLVLTEMNHGASLTNFQTTQCPIALVGPASGSARVEILQWRHEFKATGWEAEVSTLSDPGNRLHGSAVICPVEADVGPVDVFTRSGGAHFRVALAGQADGFVDGLLAAPSRFAVGYDVAVPVGVNSANLGVSNTFTTTGPNCFLFGLGSEIKGAAQLVTSVGQGNVAQGTVNVAVQVGNGNVVSGSASGATLIGVSNAITAGATGIAVGGGNTVSGNRSAAFGNSAVVTRDGVMAYCTPDYDPTFNFQRFSDTNAVRDLMDLRAKWTVATDGSRTSEVGVYTVTNAGALAEVARLDGGGGASPAAGNTGLMVLDVDNGTLERVTVGAADSGGSGFKVLRIPN